MCAPMALAAATTAISAASSIFGFMGQNAAAEANKKEANLQYANTQNQLNMRASQVDAQESQNTVQAMIDRIKAQGRISASASAMGSDAGTTARAVNAESFSAGRNLGIEDTNSEYARQGIAQDSTNAWYRRQSMENQVLPQSPLVLALNLAGSAMKGFSSYASFGGKFGGATPDAGAGGSAGGAGDASSMAGAGDAAGGADVAEAFG